MSEKEDYTKGSHHWMLTRMAGILHRMEFILNHPEIEPDLLKTYAEQTKKAAQELIDGVPMDVYLIEKIWVNPMENHDAVGYEPHTFRFTELEAQTFCDKGRMYTQQDCWAIMLGDMPEFRYKKIHCI